MMLDPRNLPGPAGTASGFGIGYAYALSAEVGLVEAEAAIGFHRLRRLSVMIHPYELFHHGFKPFDEVWTAEKCDEILEIFGVDKL